MAALGAAEEGKPVKPLVCGAPHEAAYGSDGYSSPGHWCNMGQQTIPKKQGGVWPLSLDTIHWGLHFFGFSICFENVGYLWVHWLHLP